MAQHNGSGKAKVAVIGGGVAGIVAAHAPQFSSDGFINNCEIYLVKNSRTGFCSLISG